MDRVIEVHDQEEGKAFLLNVHYIKLVEPTDAGCEICWDRGVLCVKETLAEIKAKIEECVLEIQYPQPKEKSNSLIKVKDWLIEKKRRETNDSTI